jgi:bacillithiol biosynthesis cysteine-adding enzyme BshC
LRYLREVAESHRDAEWSQALAPALRASGRAANRLERVVQGGGVVVSTGQQAALFGGPLYTLIKALSALAIADVLEQETGVPACPVFWAATDDADYEEACWAAIAVTGAVRMLRLPPAPRSGIPMSRMPLVDVAPLVEALETASGSVVEPLPLTAAGDAFVPGETLGNAYVRLLRTLLEPLGIPVLDASHPVVRESGAPVLSRALERAADLESALRERHESIRAAGYTPQVEHLPELTLVFADDADGEKRRIPVRGAAQYFGAPPGSLGPNVLLRPVVERFIMPSAAYVAGPGELAYFAQVGAVADTLQVPSPLPLPRWSATILEPRVERILERLGISREELRHREAVETRLARANVPSPLADGLRALRRDVDADLAALTRADRDQLLPAASLEGARRWIEHRIQRLERRYAAAVKRRESQLMQDIATATAALYPNGKPQERVLNFLPFWARYGSPLIEAMRGEALMHARSIIDVGSRERMPERV